MNLRQGLQVFAAAQGTSSISYRSPACSQKSGVRVDMGILSKIFGTFITGADKLSKDIEVL
ncbi:MAG: hypothetical protein C0390_04965 [Syntrophus sp. (in: bacteria)]|nr:hypothetical protein [Syntrophus sp. (in: bacteria)]